MLYLDADGYLHIKIYIFTFMLDILSCSRYNSESEGIFRLWIHNDRYDYVLSTMLHLGQYNDFSFNIY